MLDNVLDRLFALLALVHHLVVRAPQGVQIRGAELQLAAQLITVHSCHEQAIAEPRECIVESARLLLEQRLQHRVHLDQSGDRFSKTGLILFVVRQVARVVVAHFVTQEAQQFDHHGLLCTEMIGRSQLLLVRSHHLVEACAAVCERRERLIKILTNADELFC